MSRPPKTDEWRKVIVSEVIDDEFNIGSTEREAMLTAIAMATRGAVMATEACIESIVI